MTYTIQGGAIFPAQVKLTTNTPTVLVDGGQSGAIVVQIWASRLSGTPTLTLEKYDGTTSYYFRYQQAFPTTGDSSGEYIRDTIIRLKAGESLRATASVANQIDIQASYLRLDGTAKA